MAFVCGFSDLPVRGEFVDDVCRIGYNDIPGGRNSPKMCRQIYLENLSSAKIEVSVQKLSIFIDTGYAVCDCNFDSTWIYTCLVIKFTVFYHAHVFFRFPPLEWVAHQEKRFVLNYHDNFYTLFLPYLCSQDLLNTQSWLIKFLCFNSNKLSQLLQFVIVVPKATLIAASLFVPLSLYCTFSSR